jgi:hypothetical protein
MVEVHLTQVPATGMHPWVIDGICVLPPGTWNVLPRPDAYVTHLENVPPVAASARGYGVPLIVVQHNTLLRAVAELEAASPALTVLNSAWMAGRITPPGASVTVRPPVDPVAYRTEPGTAVTLINMAGCKGGELFWQLARAMPDVEFLGVQGAYGEQVTGPDGLPNVTVLDQVDGRRMRDEVYARTRILLVPSDYESWGRVATEAMCSGIPVIAHRAEGALAENLGDAAVWADRDDPQSWVRQIRRLAKPAAWQKASAAGRDRFAELDPAGELKQWCEAVEALVP